VDAVFVVELLPQPASSRAIANRTIIKDNLSIQGTAYGVSDHLALKLFGNIECDPAEESSHAARVLGPGASRGLATKRSIVRLSAGLFLTFLVRRDGRERGVCRGNDSRAFFG
jgi:hypothetical protein